MIGIKEELPPYVIFETRAEEDRQASIDSGHMVFKDVDYAVITPRGSKDRIDRKVDEWLAHITKETIQGRFDPRWTEGYKANYRAWKEGQEVAVQGTPITQWPGLSPAQVKNFQNFNLRSVEDLASANEETLGRMGFGAREIQKRARDYLETSNSVGKVAEQFGALKADNQRLASRNNELETQLTLLSNRLNALEGAAKPTKDRKTDDLELK